MKFGTKVLMLVLAGLPADVWAQRSDHAAPETSPLLWRDGYVNWRGKLVRPNWQVMNADDGTKFAIDLSKKPAHYAAAYISMVRSSKRAICSRFTLIAPPRSPR